MEIQLFFGYKAWKNIKATKEGYTHDWTLFVQGENSNEIEHIVEKVVFHLPVCYPDSNRIREKPPFVTSDSTSRNLSIQIEVFFCPEAKHTKLSCFCEIWIGDEAVSNSWKRKLRFTNPSKELKEKLLLAGGKLVDFQKTSSIPTGEFSKMKPEDEIQMENNIDGARLNSVLQKIDYLQNNKSREKELRLEKLMEENKKLKIANREIKEKIDYQEKLRAFNSKEYSLCEKKISDIKRGIDLTRKKKEAREKEISILKWQLRLLQNELENQPPEVPEEKMRKNEDMDISVEVNRKEKGIQPKNSSASQDFPLKSNFVSTQNQNLLKAVESSNANSVIRLASVSPVDGEPNHLCRGVSGLSLSKNETLFSNAHLSNRNNFGDLESRNVCDVKKFVGRSSCDLQDFLKRRVKDNAEEPVNRSSVSENSLLNAFDAENSAKERSGNADVCLNEPFSDYSSVDKSVYETSEIKPSLEAPEIRIVAEFKSTVKGCVTLIEPNPVCGSSVPESLPLNAPETMGAVPSAKGCSRSADGTRDKLHLRRIDIEKIACMEGGSLQTPTSEPFVTNKSQEQSETHVHERRVSSTNLNTVNLNRKRNVLTQNNSTSTKKTKTKHLVAVDCVNKFCTKPCGAVKASSINSSNSNRKKTGSKEKVKTKAGSMMHDIRCNETDQNLTYTPWRFTTFLEKHCRKLASELERLQNSEFNEFRERSNPLRFELQYIDSDHTAEEIVFHRLIAYFSDPQKVDTATLIYLVIDYLCLDRPPQESLPTYSAANQETLVFLPPSERCLVSAVCAVDALPHLDRVVWNTMHAIHQVVVSKRAICPDGLASLCRVFMEMCRRTDRARWVLFLCCRLLASPHPSAPFLVNSMAAVWREPFRLRGGLSEKERILLGSIIYGISGRPSLMPPELWKRTSRLKSTYFPCFHKRFTIDLQYTTEFLKSAIVSTCGQSSFQDIWILTSPLVLLVSQRGLKWKRKFRDCYILPNLELFFKCSNEEGFGVFCHLYVDICGSFHEVAYEKLLQYVCNTSIHQGIQDYAAIALLKYIGNTDRHVPVLLRDWFLKHQNNSSLAVLINTYCVKKMESNQSRVLWDDILISISF